MFEYLRGKLEDKYSTANGFYFVVDVCGVGYLVEVSEADYSAELPDGEVKLYTKLLHKEDSMSVCGFIRKETRDISNNPTSVSGVGSKMALALLGKFDACDIISIVINEEYKQLTMAKGVGVKLAQKIILELRDKLIKANLTVVPDKFSDIQLNQACKETTSVLLSLGYTDEEINTAYQVVMSRCENKDDPEELLRESLKYLSM